ncbi:hypothetical protein [Pseudomarimonas arenosa]|uniref:Carboxypeptidase regulatory-like domain-containing protein n=1 Tax=Pseudomarimonas arenosa TaxID=2774145 RepID=A0AAW3ZIK7_9GAMM|nr:hypothetical protein [Pseudomarimonas arenosa]MBD8525364.1 hypothetical protein [Pseudomarimonas arenosa]
MSGVPDPTLAVLLTLAAAALVAMARLGKQRRWALLCAQPILLAGLAGVVLWQPSNTPLPFGLITKGATAEHVVALQSRFPELEWLALPDALPWPNAQPVPDLGAALRKQPAALVLAGDGLSSDQLALLAGLPLQFEPVNPTAPGIVKLSAPRTVSVGQRWTVRGRVQPTRSGLNLHLVDPAGNDLDQTAVDEAGEFQLVGSTPLASPLRYTVELRDEERMVQSLPLPLQAHIPSQMRMLLIAATPSPELKFLRRWATDAGIQLDAQIGVAPSLALRRGQPALSPASLAELDLVLIDDRSWQQVGQQRELIVEAVRNGLGLLLRVTEPASPARLQTWQQLGLSIESTGEAPIEVQPLFLVPRLASGTALHAWPLRAVDAHPLRDDAALGHSTWNALGRGRVGLTWLNDTFQYVQQAHPEVHASHWAALLHELARSASSEPRWRALTTPLVKQRATLCGGDRPPTLIGPDGERIETLRDANTGCVGFWPSRPGLWQIESSAGQPEPQWIDVFESEQLAPLLAAQRREATEAYAKAAPWNGDYTPGISTDLQHTLLLAAWAALAMLVWLWERRLIGSAHQTEARQVR